MSLRDQRCLIVEEIRVAQLVGASAELALQHVQLITGKADALALSQNECGVILHPFVCRL